MVWNQVQPESTLEYVAVSNTASAALRGPPFAALPLYRTRLQSCKSTSAVRHHRWQILHRKLHGIAHSEPLEMHI